jgi:hypothetical protein
VGRALLRALLIERDEDEHGGAFGNAGDGVMAPQALLQLENRNHS